MHPFNIPVASVVNASRQQSTGFNILALVYVCEECLLRIGADYHLCSWMFLHSSSVHLLCSVCQYILVMFRNLLQEIRHQARPTCLVTGPNPCTVIAVEVFVEQQQIAPVRIVLEFLYTTMNWPATGFIPQENVGQAAGKFRCYFIQREQLARACRKLHFQLVSIEVVEYFERLDNQVVEWEPDRPSPVGIST